MNRPPFDTEALRIWAQFIQTERDDYTVSVPKSLWRQIVADLVAAADEIDALTGRAEEAA